MLNRVAVDESRITRSSSNNYHVVHNNVIIGCNSALLGKMVTGNNVKVESISLILRDVPDNSTVMGLKK